MSSWQMFFFGGGKCPNLGVVNVRILGVVNVRLANNLTPAAHRIKTAEVAFDKEMHTSWSEELEKCKEQ